jgi:hypothetical protein
MYKGFFASRLWHFCLAVLSSRGFSLPLVIASMYNWEQRGSIFGGAIWLTSFFEGKDGLVDRTSLPMRLNKVAFLDILNVPPRLPVTVGCIV